MISFLNYNYNYNTLQKFSLFLSSRHLVQQKKYKYEVQLYKYCICRHSQQQQFDFYCQAQGHIGMSTFKILPINITHELRNKLKPHGESRLLCPLDHSCSCRFLQIQDLNPSKTGRNSEFSPSVNLTFPRWVL